MNQVELLWAAVSLLLLGALVSMCMKCQRGRSKQEKKGLNSQRNRCEDQLITEVVRSYSMSRQEQFKMPCNMQKTSKSRKYSIPSDAGDYAEPRYQNVSGKETQPDQDAAYIEPISMDYYNCRKLLRPPSDDDSRSYQNVAGPSNGTGCSFAEVGIYENRAALHLWQTPPGSGCSSDDEPDYVNAGPGCAPNGRFPA
ncbi:linker for activation of T-cells family member 2 [Eublepharis macularius]|uniref:Linker for activation of T-cells family member 2 n=1 Tax=Eublepharis macularius TaxID=481883 RepID=A0AA97KGJ6_EUBMA|nr:linker for activation of T-cells family member 2 [Eublepharis macularius]XP_054857936.1 linker for activation of T-cells family member 2 [Eublepharis macularius]